MTSAHRTAHHRELLVPLGSLLASRFSPHQARQYVATRRTEGTADATINRALAILRRGFNLALREDPPLVGARRTFGSSKKTTFDKALSNKHNTWRYVTLCQNI